MYVTLALCKKRGVFIRGGGGKKLEPDARSEKIADRSKAGIKLREEQMRPQGELVRRKLQLDCTC
jgi:hypothetical protein